MRRLALLALLSMAGAAPAERIDRHALVSRHNVTLNRIDPHAPLMLGNGNLGFTADITGLQTFPDQYSPLAPLLTMAQWAWHSFPNPEGYSEADGLVRVPVPGRGEQPYPWIRDWSELERRPALVWLRENPHRFSLGRIALTLDGSAPRFEQVGAASQRLDLWTGALASHFTLDGANVAVETRVAADRDMVLVSIRSPLVAAGRLGVEVRYPGVSAAAQSGSGRLRPRRRASHRNRRADAGALAASAAARRNHLLFEPGRARRGHRRNRRPSLRDPGREAGTRSP